MRVNKYLTQTLIKDRRNIKVFLLDPRKRALTEGCLYDSNSVKLQYNSPDRKLAMRSFALEPLRVNAKRRKE
jgi:hypothetical protein